jgi:hypothetical protein
VTTPKQQFAKHPYHGAFYDLTASDDFTAAVNYAMLQFVHEQYPPGDNIAAAQANANKLEGAKQFQRILLTLADPPIVPADIKPDPMRPIHQAGIPAYRPNKPKGKA